MGDKCNQVLLFALVCSNLGGIDVFHIFGRESSWSAIDWKKWFEIGGEDSSEKCTCSDEYSQFTQEEL